MEVLFSGMGFDMCCRGAESSQRMQQLCGRKVCRARQWMYLSMLCFCWHSQVLENRLEKAQVKYNQVCIAFA